MKVTADKLEGSRVSLEVESPHEVVDEALDSAYKKVVRKVTIPGFRRGKAPKNLVERYFAGQLYDEAMQEALPSAYYKAVEETKISPIEDPEFSDVHFVKGEPLRFVATVSVVPEVELADYNSISVPFESPSVSEEDVELQVDMLKERMAELRPLEEGTPLQEGNYVNCHVKSVGTEAEIARDMNYLEVGSEDTFIKGLAQALIGMKKGEVKEFEGDFPLENETPTPFMVNVEVKEAYEKHMPENEEVVAKNLGKSSPEEVREEVKKNLLEHRLKMAKEQHSQKVEEELLKKSSFEIPAIMIQRRAAMLLERFENRLREIGMDFQNYLESSGKTSDDLRAELEGEAEKDVRRDLVLDAISQTEDIQVPEESLNSVVQGLATEMGQDPKAVRTTLEIRGALDDIKAQLGRIETLNAMAVKAAVNAGTPLPEPVKEDEESPEKAADDQDMIKSDEPEAL